MDLFVGIDGGGTKTEFVLFDLHGYIKNKVILEGSNPNDIGIETCLQRLILGLDTLLDHITPKAIFAGIAGVTTGNYISILQTSLTHHYNTKVVVDSDACNVLSMAKDPNHSAALICGTGSCVFVRQNENRYRIGGWGYLFDEAGSGYDLGKDAIRHTLAVNDGLVEATLLSTRVEETMGGNIWNNLSSIYQKGRPYIASLAKLVLETNDTISKDILDQNANRLAQLIKSAKKQYHVSNEFIASGGLLHNQLFKETIEKKANITLLIPDIAPVYGACIEVLRIHQLEIPKDFKSNFIESYR